MTEEIKKPERIEFSKEILDILKKLDEANDYAAFELLYMNEPTSKYYNGLNIIKLDVSKKPGFFRTTVLNPQGKVETNDMLILNFLRFYFKNILKYDEMNDFIKNYNKIIGGGGVTSGELIKVEPFSYQPKDVKKTFLSLVTKTYPHGHEDEVLQFLPKLQKDIVGNYYLIIGEKPETMFTSHLDTADRAQSTTKLYSVKDGEDEFIVTDKTTILGADDKAGVTVMLYMISHNVPGLYYFFIGEERGGIGSGQLSYVYDDVDYLKNIKRCVSFDRRDTCSVITQQLGRVCCSNEFATALCKEYNSLGLKLSLDPTGIYTDSASFLENIQECTNISVGYYREHTRDEKQNITYLKKLAEASVKVNWNSLPSVRKIGLDEEVLRKHGPMIAELKKTPFDNEVKVVGEEGSVFIQCDMEAATIDGTYETLTMLQFLLNKYKINQKVFFDGEYIKVPLV